MKAGSEAKFWLEPDILLESSSGFDARTLRKLTGIVEQHQDLIKETWHEYFG